MRIFTLEAYNQLYDYSDDRAPLTVFDRYRRHLEEMEGVLLPEVLALARLDGVDDGLIVSVSHDRERRELVLTMRCGYLAMGYYDLEITYEGASLSPEHDTVLAYIARHQTLDIIGRFETVGDLAFHEVDRSDDGKIEHRLLFHPGKWFVIRCDTLHWRQIPRLDRKLPRRRDRYPEGPHTA